MSDDEEPQPIVSMFVNEAESWLVDPQMIPFILTVPFTPNNKNAGPPHAKPYIPHDISALMPMAGDPEPVSNGVRRRLATLWARLVVRRGAIPPAEETQPGDGAVAS
jgi:hypothetical protein